MLPLAGKDSRTTRELAKAKKDASDSWEACKREKDVRNGRKNNTIMNSSNSMYCSSANTLATGRMPVTVHDSKSREARSIQDIHDREVTSDTEKTLR
jgi:hypothetical protein